MVGARDVWRKIARSLAYPWAWRIFALVRIAKSTPRYVGIHIGEDSFRYWQLSARVAEDQATLTIELAAVGYNPLKRENALRLEGLISKTLTDLEALMQGLKLLRADVAVAQRRLG